MNFHKRLRNDYGKDCLKNIRLLEKTGIKQSRYRNHLRFSLHCNHHNITPVSLHLSSSVIGSKADNILRRAERSLLNVSIGQVVQKLKHLDNEKDRLGDLIFRASPLSADDKAEVKQRVTKSEVKEHDTCKQRQQRKFTRLVEKKEQQDKRKFNNNIAADCISKWVKNCSQRILSDPELHVLARGLNFAVTEDEVPIVEFITATESACRNLPETQANELRSKVVNLQFVELIQDQRVEEDEELRSYDVSALFTSVPVDKALRIVRSRLEQDSALGDRTELTPDQIVRLCETCLKQYFIYNGDYYEQLHGAAMGLPLSPILCDIYMEDLEQRAIATAPHPPLWWFRYVDDTPCKLKKCHSQEFTDHLNSLDKDIKFTTEGEENDSLAFLDTVIQPDRSIKVTIYRKSTHTDQYLNFSSNHPIDHKLGVIRTLYHRADTVVTNLQDREDEKAHVNNALVKCGYPKWALDKATEPKTHKTSDVGDKRPNKGHVVLPYIKSTSEAIRRTFSNYGVSVFFKPTRTVRQILVSPKDKTDKKDITGPVYYIPCQGKTVTGTGQCK
ncbi:uncharacterized protein [Amphiura filiformis]|uniref:uncharacterized protein n=1 Tax=Amphiura filiformis TaxID=82378 RepID=UPI003B225090